ncbi:MULTISPECIES: CBS domain-containing protein [unclassified Moorena]|uniref:CBS domain-containing protein n=1 Tax=unclassified Moorena TaxID=2683338 RepID=UPI00140005F0|nr:MULTISPECIES: CBS domain-containing protein [unclassified Moorena]NEO15168.1 CBS domain-containing protein [Moorena sp. SIO3E8]NEQ01441.1 CBS domain-containing protein [Moorena sp. SIO3F7]
MSNSQQLYTGGNKAVKQLRYHMSLQGLSNLLNSTIDIKAQTQVSTIAENQKITEDSSDQESDQSVKAPNIYATSNYDGITFEEEDTHLAYILQSSLDNKVNFEGYTTQSDNGSFQVTGRILFGGKQHILNISTSGSGQLLASPDSGYKQGAIAFGINSGTGIFEHATGFITSNFIVGESGEYRDVHTATLFLKSKEKDGLTPEEERLLVRDVMDEKAFPVTMDASIEYIADLLALTHASELMVIDEQGNFIGVVSEVDLLQVLIPDIDEIVRVGGTLKDALNIFIRNGPDLAAQPIRRLVKSNARTVRPDDELVAVATVMLHSNARRLPVVEQGAFVGSISLEDICWAVLSKWNGIRQN